MRFGNSKAYALSLWEFSNFFVRHTTATRLEHPIITVLRNYSSCNLNLLPGTLSVDASVYDYYTCTVILLWPVRWSGLSAACQASGVGVTLLVSGLYSDAQKSATTHGHC